MNYQIISNGNEGVFIDDKIGKYLGKHFQWKVDITYIKLNSDGGFPAGFNSVEVGRN